MGLSIDSGDFQKMREGVLFGVLIIRVNYTLLESISIRVLYFRKLIASPKYLTKPPP